MECKLLVAAAPEPLIGHNGKVWSLSWSPDPCNRAESMLASSGQDGLIVWQCCGSQWSIYKRLGGESICTCAWRPDGKVLAAGGCNSRVALWEYKEDKASFELITELNGPWNHVIKSVSWSEDGEYLLFCSEDGVVFIVAKSSDQYKVQRVVKTARDLLETSCSAWHPSKKQFVVAGYLKFKIYEVRQIKLKDDESTIVEELFSTEADFRQSHKYHRAMITAITYSRNGTIVSADANGIVLFWEFQEHKPVTPMFTIPSPTKKLIPKTIWNQKLSEPIMCIDWSRSENSVAIGCLTNMISIISIQDDKDKRNKEYPHSEKYAHNDAINDVKWAPKKESLLASASSDGQIKLWKIEGQSEVLGKLSISDCSEYQETTKRQKIS